MLILGRDTLPYAVKDGFRYRHALPLKEKIQQEIAKKRAAGEDVSQPKKKAKKKEVYLVNKAKYYSEVTDEEGAREIDLNSAKCQEELEDMHRLLQHKVR